MAGSALAEPPPKRPIPRYDDRPRASATVTDVVLWAPRIVLFPVRIVVDYGVRRPIGWLTESMERSRTARRVFKYFAIDPKTPTPAIFPVAMYDFGAKSSVGVRLRWDDGFLTPGSRLSLKLGTGGSDWWRIDGGVRVAVGAGFVGLEAGAREQPDHRFYGIGPRTPESAAARFGARRSILKLAAGWTFGGWGEVSAFGASTTASLRSSSYGGDPSIEARVASGAIEATPAGYGSYGTYRAGGKLVLDTRAGGKRARSGGRLDATLERVWDDDMPSQRWTRLDARVGAALLLDAVSERKVDVKLELQLVEPARDAVAVPFLELASVAGGDHLRGFPTGRLYGESAAALVVDYRWPVAAWLDARAHVGVGNVFGPRWSGLTAGAMRGSTGLGFLLAGLSDDRQLELSASVGTEPFESGLDVTSFRLVAGFTHDY